ncbi:primosomal protein N' [Eremococcus coleocola]|uniref:primosomal protein N' n=1 Tax=Eremococcus coleocola TaxID=88132 RepID=UPI000402F98E|nr:primosomal protein N' [Eremococcus coleocola]
MIGKIIVDIPVAQVNRPFDYKIPKKFEALIQVGMRVKVPFGSRHLLGFVVELVDETNFDGKLKEISALLDYQPFLNQELISLAHQLAHDLQVFEISMLEAMLPNMLRVKYETRILIHDRQSFEAETGILAQEAITKEDLEAKLSAYRIRKLVDQGIIELEYHVVDQTSQKYIKMVEPLLDQTGYQAILDNTPANYRNLRALLNYLRDVDDKQAIPAKSVMTDTKIDYQVLKRAQDKGWLRLNQVQAYRDPLKHLDLERSQKQDLKPEQLRAYEAIALAIDTEKNDTFLVEGVTGSGKTEVYLQLIDRVVEKGQTALLLVPEISLTPQMVERVVGRFGQGVAVLHSGLSTAERYDEWRRILKHEAKIVVGARSSVFAPLENIGIIIMDEEHESTYKQSDNPRYHARQVAKLRAKYHHCPLVLGSATPSIESRTRAQVGNYHLITMKDRVNQAPLPPVQIVDMSQMLAQETLDEFSPLLKEAIQTRLDKQEQIILLLNRRGYSSYLMCRECGHVIQCPRCDISLTYHKHDAKLKCHYCDYREQVPQTCPQCGSRHLRGHGLGTQKVYESLQSLFPQARILRMDNDTTRRKGQHEQILNQFGQGQADILLGTQMIAKGLDFEKVTLVGVINADTSLNLPDFRAAEKSFQLLTQVAGRTGRGAYQGQVIIQTYNPQHYVLHFAQKHDYEGFYYYEMQRRHMAAYPPYYFMTLITVSSKYEGKALRKAYDLKSQLNQSITGTNRDFILLGPSQSGIAKINNQYYFQLLLKYKQKSQIDQALDIILESNQSEVKNGIYVTIDNDPLFFM